MDSFFPDEFQDVLCWFEIDPPNRSAFEPYTDRPRSRMMKGESSGSGDHNMNKRVIEFMRRRRCDEAVMMMRVESAHDDSESSDRCHRHMLSERLRREKEKKAYLALHSLLPLGTKNDKNSIIQTAVRKIEELQRCKEYLEQQNREVEARLAAAMRSENSAGVTKIKFKVNNPTSGVDSIVEVLRCLKGLGAKPRCIQSKFSDQQLLALLAIETNKVEAAEVEKAMHTTLSHVERERRKILLNSPQKKPRKS